MRIRLFAFCLLLGGCQSQLPPLPDWQSPRKGATIRRRDE